MNEVSRWLVIHLLDEGWGRVINLEFGNASHPSSKNTSCSTSLHIVSQHQDSGTPKTRSRMTPQPVGMDNRTENLAEQSGKTHYLN